MGRRTLPERAEDGGRAGGTDQVAVDVDEQSARDMAVGVLATAPVGLGQVPPHIDDANVGLLGAGQQILGADRP